MKYTRRVRPMAPLCHIDCTGPNDIPGSRQPDFVSRWLLATSARHYPYLGVSCIAKPMCHGLTGHPGYVAKQRLHIQRAWLYYKYRGGLRSPSTHERLNVHLLCGYPGSSINPSQIGLAYQLTSRVMRSDLVLSTIAKRSLVRRKAGISFCPVQPL